MDLKLYSPELHFVFTRNTRQWLVWVSHWTT